MGLWRKVSEKVWFNAVMRGVNAAAVGLVFTAVYKLWMIGNMGGSGGAGGAGLQGGSPLSNDPWLVLITATAYVGGAWFNVEPPVAILVGGALGLGRWGVVEGTR